MLIPEVPNLWCTMPRDNKKRNMPTDKKNTA